MKHREIELTDAALKKLKQERMEAIAIFEVGVDGVITECRL